MTDESQFADDSANGAPVSGSGADAGKEFIEHVVKQIVDNPQDVEIVRSVDEMGVLLTLKVNPADMGKIIGKSGQTAKALRILLRIIGSRNNSRVNLKIVEPGGEQA